MKILLLLFLMVTPLFGEKLGVASYWVGKGMTPKDVSFRFYVSDEQDNVDPFAEASLTEGKKADEEGKRRIEYDEKIPLLKSAPFTSRFFNPEDELFDVTPYLNFGKGVLTPESKIILNKSTGRLVVKAPEMTLMLLSDFFKRDDDPVVITMDARIYELAQKERAEQMKRLQKDPSAMEAIAELGVTSRPGDKVSAEGGGLNLAWEPNVDKELQIIDSRINLAGSVMTSSGKVDVSLQTAIASYHRIPLLMELGSLGDSEKTLVLSVVATVRTLDGTLHDELVLNEVDHRTDRERLAPRFWDSQRIDKKLEGGRVLSSLFVPPNFWYFLMPNNTDGEGTDPFADAGDAHERELAEVMRKLLITPDASIPIPRRAADRVIDFKGPLEENGVKFGKDDFAVMNIETGQLLVALDWVHLELLDAIMSATCIHLPSHVETSLTLLEGDREFGMKDLLRHDVKQISRISAYARPGDEAHASLASGKQVVTLDLGPNIGASGDILDLRMVFKLKGQAGVESSINSGVTLRSGMPFIIQRYRHGEKWRVLIVESAVKNLSDDSFGE